MYMQVGIIAGMHHKMEDLWYTSAASAYIVTVITTSAKAAWCKFETPS